MTQTTDEDARPHEDDQVTSSSSTLAMRDTTAETSKSIPSETGQEAGNNAAQEASKEKETLSLRPTTGYKFETLAQKNPHPMDHPSITFGPPVIILLDLVVPVIIYYSWYNSHKSGWLEECRPYTSQGQTCPIARPEFDKDILGYTIISFGFGELYILLARVWRLFYHRHECAPLLSRSKWDLDATSWVYAVAMLCALIPFVVGSSLVIPELYLYGPAFLMAFLGVLMVCTLFPIKIPIGINSHARGSGLRPFIYYAAEDFIAVDGLQDREFRFRYNKRYENSKAFRRLFLGLTLWWIFGVCVYIGCLSAIIWTLPFHYAFGLSLGVLFSYIIVWAIVSYVWVQIEIGREKKAHEAIGAVATV